jgi:hypothetical protein
MQNILKAPGTAAATALILVVSLSVGSLTVQAQNAPARQGHAQIARSASARHATFTIHDHTLLMQAVIENLPKLLVTQELGGNLMSTTYSGVITPPTGSPPAWPPQWFCHVTTCALDPTLILTDMESATFISKKDRQLAKLALAAAPKLAESQPTSKEQSDITQLMQSLMADTSDSQIVSGLKAAAPQYPELKTGIASAIKIVKDGESTIYSPSWLTKVEAKDWGLVTIAPIRAARRAFWEELWTTVKDAGGAIVGALNPFSSAAVGAVEASCTMSGRNGPKTAP